MQPERLPQQSARATARHRGAEFATGNDSEPRSGTGRGRFPIGNQAPGGQPLPLLLELGEVTALFQAHGPGQSKRGPLRGHSKSDRREALAALTTTIPQNGATAPAGIAAQEAVLPSAANFRRLILTFHAMIQFNFAWSTNWVRTRNDRYSLPVFTECESLTVEVRESRVWAVWRLPAHPKWSVA